ncbi:MAG: hypothetical protein LBC27_07395 [Spirochaetaceae bacterium]|jgi:hypothetical protein|nr:hypothetical protein [Spirochaetaceae bacterium]
MDKKFIRVYFSGYVEKEIPKGATEDEIYEIRQNFFDLTPEDIGKCMTEYDWRIYPDDC